MDRKNIHGDLLSPPSLLSAVFYANTTITDSTSHTDRPTDLVNAAKEREQNTLCVAASPALLTLGMQIILPGVVVFDGSRRRAGLFHFASPPAVGVFATRK